MAIFPILESENDVQIKDKTRIEAFKSFISNDNDPITSVLIKPGLDLSEYEVFNEDSTRWYLDWYYSDFSGDFDSSNSSLDFQEEGALPQSVTLTAGTYTLSQLAVEIQTKVNAAATGVYTFSYDDKDRLTVTGNNRISFLPETGENRTVSVFKVIGVLKDTQFKSEHIFERTEYLPKKITLTLDDEDTPAAVTQFINVYSKEGDMLFSNDGDLRGAENEIRKWIPDGKASFNYVHREAQRQILAYLDEQGYVNVYDEKFRKRDLILIDEFKEWSKWLTLKLIFDDVSNSLDDIFFKKARDYEAKMVSARNRGVLRLDINRDGVVDTFEDIRFSSGSVYTR